MLLDVLHDLHVPATFFLIGQDARQWPELTQRIEADGNEIGDHTYTHPNLDQESADQVRKEILEGRDALWQLSHDPAVRRADAPAPRSLHRRNVARRSSPRLFRRAVDR